MNGFSQVCVRLCLFVFVYINKFLDIDSWKYIIYKQNYDNYLKLQCNDNINNAVDFLENLVANVEQL